MGHQKLDGNVENRHMTKITGKGGGGRPWKDANLNNQWPVFSLRGKKKTGQSSHQRTHIKQGIQEKSCNGYNTDSKENEKHPKGHTRSLSQQEYLDPSGIII